MSNLIYELRQASLKNGIILGLFALVSTGLIAAVYLITKDKIAQEVEASVARRLNEIVLKTEYDNDVYHDCKFVTNQDLLGSKEPQKVYRMRNKNRDYAIILSTVAPDGYAGKIKLIVGIYRDGSLAGVRVTEHKETPGLGDKIDREKSEWIEQFNKRSLKNSPAAMWKVKKDGGDFDALTGATITPRAIINAVYKALGYYQHHTDVLFNQDNPCQ